MRYIELYREFLTFLSSSDNPKTYGEIMKRLSINQSQLEKILKHMKKYYDNVGHKEGKEHEWNSHLIEINHEGILYLEKLGQNKNLNMNKLS